MTCAASQTFHAACRSLTPSLPVGSGKRLALGHRMRRSFLTLAFAGTLVVPAVGSAQDRAVADSFAVRENAVLVVPPPAKAQP